MRILGVIGYLLVFLKAITEAWIDTVRISINGDIKPEIVEIKSIIDSPAGLVLLGWSITATPGTLVIDIDEKNKILKVASIYPRKREDIVPFEPYIKKIFD
ncbi:monovalent cation/H+ antiporter subunit E [Methanocaldococcus indicus]|uniref:monovalent cation/H+ antiporter subunit E n=1 Tax=Methanocaldococcus indicus TaxID=213231 RepID=UPI003C6D04FF